MRDTKAAASRMRITSGVTRVEHLQTGLSHLLVRADTRRMVLRIALVAALIAGALVVIRQKQVLQHAGLVGYCQQIATPAGQSGIWHACKAGKLTGTPGLTLGSCTRTSHGPDRDLWRCPTALESDQVRQ